VVSGTISSGRAAGERAGAAGLSEAGGGRRGRRRWVAVVLVVVVLVAAGVVGAALTGVFNGSSSANGGTGSGYKASTATVRRQTLTSQTTVDATLGYAGSYTISGKGSGTLTWLPPEGRVIRQGQVLYRVDNHVPVILLYGTVPLWRALAEGVMGQDVAQLNHDLVKLGYASSADIAPLGWDFSAGRPSTRWSGCSSRWG
jgi:hypothetical protein